MWILVGGVVIVLAITAITLLTLWVTQAEAEPEEVDDGEA